MYASFHFWKKKLHKIFNFWFLASPWPVYSWGRLRTLCNEHSDFLWIDVRMSLFNTSNWYLLKVVHIAEVTLVRNIPVPHLFKQIHNCLYSRTNCLEFIQTLWIFIVKILSRSRNCVPFLHKLYKTYYKSDPLRHNYIIAM